VQVVTDIRKEDVWYGTRYIVFHHPVMRKRLVRSVCLGFIYFLIAFLIFSLVIKLFPPTVAVIGSVIGYAVFLAIHFLVIMPVRIRKMPIPENGVLGKHVIEINEEGFRESTDVNESFQKWNTDTLVLQDDKYIFIFANNFSAHIIPKRSFKDASEAERFHSMAYRYWQNTRGNTNL
jgi:hypothetical protein